VASVDVLALVLSRVTTLDLQEADVVPDVLHTVGEPMHTIRQEPVVEVELRQLKPVPPRVRAACPRVRCRHRVADARRCP
jgi:hypothetical protein